MRITSNSAQNKQKIQNAQKDKKNFLKESVDFANLYKPKWNKITFIDE